MLKINEKNLSSYAVSPASVDREGWLNKRGEINKSYQKRWFILKGNLLFYFEKPGDKEPIGLIILEGSTVELAEDDEQFSFKIVFHGPNNRLYILAAESQESMENWMKSLACARFDYIKSMVVELQQQLDSLTDNNDFNNSLQFRVSTLNNDNNSTPPVAPPRRQNPFMRSAPPPPNLNNSNSTRIVKNHTKITFRELHTRYSHKILSDLNSWRHSQRQKEIMNSANNSCDTADLITF